MNLSTASVADCWKICEALKSDTEIIKVVSPHAVQDEEELFKVLTPWYCRFTGPNIFSYRTHIVPCHPTIASLYRCLNLRKRNSP
jgi:hypothetical protein